MEEKPRPDARWPAYARSMVGTFTLALAAVAAFVALLNPYGNLPGPLRASHVIMDSDQRFQYPAIARSGRYDSAVFGTSAARLLPPAGLQSVFGGHFANLAVNDARAWEQYQLALLYLRHTPAPRTILLALDWVWCTDRAAIDRTRPNEFPDWLYDDDPWNDWNYVLNGRALEISLRKLGYLAGIGHPRFPFDGYEVFVPPDVSYDAAKASAKIWSGPRPPPARPIESKSWSREERSGWSTPALDWLADLVHRIPPTTSIVIAFMPAHVAALPAEGSIDAAKLDECKTRVVTVAHAVGAPVIDFGFRSTLTETDANFWDARHYRVAIADRIVAAIAAAETGRAGDDTGQWRLLAARRSPPTR